MPFFKLTELFQKPAVFHVVLSYRFLLGSVTSYWLQITQLTSYQLTAKVSKAWVELRPMQRILTHCKSHDFTAIEHFTSCIGFSLYVTLFKESR